jgi:hypothetical protein
MQLNATSGPPRIIQTKRGACPKFHVADTSGITVI